MPYQTGTVGPITYSQDNSGNPDDITTALTYTPQEYGAPQGAQIMPGVSQSVHVFRGKAYVENLIIGQDSITFQVYTQAANDGLFGWHSGSITVSTTFQWSSD
jgi:multidrug efflux pump subunit AcrA (membrane-fusion protein)